jgi:hypothetical protein
VADVIAAVGFPNWVLAMVSAIAGVLGAAVVYTALDIPGVPAESAAAPIAGEVLSPTGFLNISGVPAVVGVFAVVGVPTVAGATVVNIPSA